MNSRWRAPAIDSARKRSAAVLPMVGIVCSAPATTVPDESNTVAGKKSRPVSSWPVASAQPTANAAWSCPTAGPVKRTLLSRHWPSVRPPPSQ